MYWCQVFVKYLIEMCIKMFVETPTWYLICVLLSIKNTWKGDIQSLTQANLT